MQARMPQTTKAWNPDPDYVVLVTIPACPLLFSLPTGTFRLLQKAGTRVWMRLEARTEAHSGKSCLGFIFPYFAETIPNCRIHRREAAETPKMAQ